MDFDRLVPSDAPGAFRERALPAPADTPPPPPRLRRRGRRAISGPALAARGARRAVRACALVSLVALVAAGALIAAPVSAQALPAPAPGTLTVGYESQNGFAVFWIEVPHAAEYKLEVKRTSDGDGAWQRVTAGDFGPLPGGGSSYSLTGVATGLDCNTTYDIRMSVRGDGNHYTTGFGPAATNTAKTTECADTDRVTNLRSTTEPGVVTLTWTAPTDTKYTGIQVLRIDLADSTPTTIHDNNTDTATRYEDRTALAGRSYSYVVLPIEELATPTISDGTTHTHRAHVNGRANTPRLRLAPDARALDPRNMRLTQDTPDSRTLQWDQPINIALTIEHIYRGETTTPVADPWITGYTIERLDHEAHKRNPTLWTATMTVATIPNLSDPNDPHQGYVGVDSTNPFGALTPDTFNTCHGSFKILSLTRATSIPVLTALVPTSAGDAIDYWTLVVDGDPFPTSSSSRTLESQVTRLLWPYFNQPWTDGQQVSLEIREQRPAEWETLRAAGEADTTTTLTDSQHYECNYVYRVTATNAAGTSGTYDRTNWAWMGIADTNIGGL